MDNQPMPQKETRNSLGVPIAIVIAALLIGGAIIYSKKIPSGGQGAGNQTTSIGYNEYKVDPVTSGDHILGSKEANLVFVEYSDTECPYCKQFQTSMNQLIDEYGKDGKASWVYRHFPLYKPGVDGQALHSKAGKEAEATECVAEIGGNQKFWEFIDEVYRVTPSNNGLDAAKLPTIALGIGIDKTKFDVCLASGKYAGAIDKAYTKATEAGAQGTPHVVIMFKKGLSEKQQEELLAAIDAQFAKIAPGSALPLNFFTYGKDAKSLAFSGALPYPLLKTIVDTTLSFK